MGKPIIKSQNIFVYASLCDEKINSRKRENENNIDNNCHGKAIPSSWDAVVIYEHEKRDAKLNVASE